MSKQVKVLYLFAGERKALENKWRDGVMPDSSLIGFNHLILRSSVAGSANGV